MRKIDNMNFGISFLQGMYMSYEQFDKLDCTDACIMACILDFAGSDRCETTVKDGQIYYWISSSVILRDLPMCRIKTKSGIKRRLNKLEEAGLIEPYEGNQQVGRSYYKLTKECEKIKYGKAKIRVSKTYNPCANQQDPLCELAQPPYASSHNDYINNNTNNTNTNIERENLAKAKPLTKEEKILSCKKREEEFITLVNTFSQYPKELLDEFINYWTERTPSGFKMNWETKKTFEIKKRLITWSNNQKKFDRGGAKFERKPKLEQYHNDPSLDDFDVNARWEEYQKEQEKLNQK